MTTRTLFSILAFLLIVSLAHASDERSIKELAKGSDTTFIECGSG